MRTTSGKKTGPYLPIILLIALSLLISSGIALVAEARPFFAAVGNRADRFEAIYQDRIRIGFSQLSARVVLDSCTEATTSVYGRMQPVDRRNVVIANCIGQSNLISEAMPTNGLAWYVGAFLAAEQTDFDAMNSHLEHSYRTSPNEQWIAELRVKLAEKFFEQLDESYGDLHRRDLAMIVQNSRGIRNIAARWVRYPDFRERITEIVNELPEQSQAKFVRRVRAAAAALGN